MIAIGCPVRDRAWILARWFEHVERAFEHVDEQPHFIFVGDPRSDPRSFALVDEICLRRSWSRDVVELEEFHRTHKREWNLERFTHMAELRNLLLERVRGLAPAHFWSVDSDILVHPWTLEAALTALAERGWDAVGSKTYMTPYGTAFPSFAMLNNGGLMRWEDEGCFPVDVIMAMKLMTPAAYAVDYTQHQQGEDIGWSNNARARGLKLGWSGQFASRHVMEQRFLDGIDERCGF